MGCDGAKARGAPENMPEGEARRQEAVLRPTEADSALSARGYSRHPPATRRAGLRSGGDVRAGRGIEAVEHALLGAHERARVESR